ncbi:ABC transporter ATP-binding protein [Halorussus litoreus]|uniref:ABC transporter ATP-binding protein n=1 Tax=Halorussus litoreus TaxID=1710536 RepID=UPI000E27BDE5|nr:ABC transporter ATP-binding protein [Halorussus litoreus]
MSGSDEPLLEVSGLTKHFAQNDSLLRRLRPDQSVQTVQAVDGVDLRIRDGETVGLVGESGCGKSTFGRLVLRLLDPTAGSISYRGEAVDEFDAAALREYRSHAQMIFQDPFGSLNPRYTVRETLVEPMEVHDIGASSAERVQQSTELLERVRLGAEYLDRYPHELSGGQRQRVAIARALAVEPEFVVADEPTSALDVSVQVEILDLLGELQEEMDLTLLFITHDLSVIRHVSDRIAVMYLGNLVEIGETESVFTNPSHPYTQALLSSIPNPDPSATPDRIPLAGDVPTPIDPPSGCQFHPRCPKIVPPEEWDHDQRIWRELFRLRTRLANGEIEPDAVRSTLVDGDERADDDAVVDALYRNQVEERVGNATDRAVPDSAATVAREALAELVVGNDDDAVARLEDAGFVTVCETEEPDLTTTEHGTDVRCHLHSEATRDHPDRDELRERNREKIL